MGSITCGVLDGRPIAVSGTSKGVALVWDLATGRAMYRPFDAGDHYMSCTACVELNDRQVVVTVSMDDSVRVWDLATGEPTERFAVDDVGMWAGCCVVDGHLVLASSTLGQPLRSHSSVTGGKLARTPDSHLFRALTVGRLKGRPIVVTGSEDWTVQIWDLPTCHPLGPPLTGHTRSVWTVALAELDGRPVILTGSADNTLRIWDLEHRTTLDVIHLPGPCSAVALSEEGLLACAFGNDIAVFTRR